MKRLIALLLLVLLPLCACGREAPEPYAVSLWYAEGDPLAAPLEKLAEEYNRTKDRDALPVALRAFGSEEQLAASLDTARPDLLLCAHERAFDLDERGLLTAAEAGGFAYPEKLAARCEGIGRSVFPLGAQVPLLCGEAESWDPDGLSAFTADAFAPLIYQQMLDRGSEFLALPDRDPFNEDYREVYNGLAEAVFTGRLLLSETPGAELVESGALPCAFVLSDALAASPSLPVLAPEGESCLAEGRCLAVLTREGRQSRGTGAFLRWLLSEDRAARLALDAGLAPMTGAELTPGTPLEAALLEIAAEKDLHLPGPESSYVRNRERFELFFRQAAEFLK